MHPSWPPAHPIFCLVTDRRLLVSATAQAADPFVALLQQVEAAANARVDLVHIRERDLDGGALCGLVRQCVAITRGSTTRVVVNDRLDVALAAGADGVHLRADSLPSPGVCALAPPGFLVGRSIRGASDLSAIGPVDYAVLGTIFPTPSKEGAATVIGVKELHEAARGASIPVIAIGGITAERLPDVARSGAAGIAAIRLFARPDEGWQGLAERVASWRELFDTNRTIS